MTGTSRSRLTSKSLRVCFSIPLAVSSAGDDGQGTQVESDALMLEACHGR
jgi:hypothetical protein